MRAADAIPISQNQRRETRMREPRVFETKNSATRGLGRGLKVQGNMI
jgi:hypothetical protein